jgi:hypothetical protein
MDRRRFIGGAAAALVGGLIAPARLPAASPSAPPIAWKPLFDGHSLDGWTIFQQGVRNRGAHAAVRIANGMLHFLGPEFDGPDSTAFGHIATTATYANYHLQAEFRWGQRRFAPRDLQRRNSGLLYHMAPDRDRLYPVCVEFQIEEGDVGDAIMVNTRARQGPLLGGTPLWPNWFPGLPDAYHEPIVAGGIARQWHVHSGPYERLDAWNTIDLFAFDDQAAQLVNGRIVNTLFAMIDRNGHPLNCGRIALEFEAAEISFRNVRIRDLPPEETARIKSGR